MTQNLITPLHVANALKDLTNLGLMTTPGEGIVQSWYHRLGPCTIQDFEQAQTELIATWNRNQEWHINFTHLMERIKAVRARRHDTTPTPVPPPQLANWPAEERAWLAAARLAIGNGATTTQAANYAAHVTGHPPRPAIETTHRPINQLINSAKIGTDNTTTPPHKPQDAEQGTNTTPQALRDTRQK